MKENKFMKNILIFVLIWTGTANHIVAQADTTIFDAVEIMPQPKGGMAIFNKYLMKNLEFPKSCKKTNIISRMDITFVVSEIGKIIDAAITYPKDICPAANEKIKAMMINCPNWEPGKQGGKTVKVRYTLRMCILLQE